MKTLAFALSLALASPALATQEYILPTLFDVSGVAADDVLNIRAEPNASSEIIGTLAPDATQIEVFETRGNWGLVNSSERSGWVSMRYLDYRTDVWEAGALPENLTCLGNEPFWSIAAEGSDLVFKHPEGEERYPALRVLDDGIPRSPRRALVAGEGANRMSAVITPQICSDTMSDMAYGLSATLIVEGAHARDGAQMLHGCCLAGGTGRN